MARPKPAAAAESSECGRGNAVGLTSIFLDRRQFFLVSINVSLIKVGPIYALLCRKIGKEQYSNSVVIF